MEQESGWGLSNNVLSYTRFEYGTQLYICLPLRSTEATEEVITIASANGLSINRIQHQISMIYEGISI